MRVGEKKLKKKVKTFRPTDIFEDLLGNIGKSGRATHARRKDLATDEHGQTRINGAIFLAATTTARYGLSAYITDSVCVHLCLSVAKPLAIAVAERLCCCSETDHGEEP